MAKFKTGQSGNPQGRPKGATNVITKELRAKLKNLIDAEFESLPGLLSDLEPKDRLDMIVRLLPFAMPKVESVHADMGEPGNKFTMDDFLV